MNLSHWLTPTSEAIRIVRSVFASAKRPLTTKDVFRLSLRQPPQKLVAYVPPPSMILDRRGRKRRGPWAPPHPEHPIRSINYLKNVILVHLTGQGEIEKFHMQVSEPVKSKIQKGGASAISTATAPSSSTANKMVSTWLWRLQDPSRNRPPSSGKSEKKPVFGAEVGVSSDILHLNKRRQRTRNEKTKRNLEFLMATKREAPQASLGDNK